MKFSFALSVALFVRVANVASQVVETGWFSEEGNAMGSCPARGNSQSILKGLFCSGKYCDNLKLQCAYKDGVSRGFEHWTPFFSEEDGLRECPDRSVVNGMACRGSYCDDISLRCLPVRHSRSGGFCDETDWLSEEHGGHKVIPSHSYAVGVRCRGSYCDDKKIRYCYESGHGPNSDWFSEENNGEGICPQKGGSQSILTGLSCSGAYCDNLKVHCASRGTVRVRKTYWSSWFSEESTQKEWSSPEPGLWKCSYNAVITGIRCRGSYCDDLSLECTQMKDFPHVNYDDCGQTEWFSEENEGYGEIPDNSFPIGIRCRGDYCDDKKIYYCSRTRMQHN